MNKLLLVIDAQKTFINENTKPYIKKIIRLIESKEYEKVAFTKFINSKDSIWYKKLNYKGCMTEEDQSIMIDIKNNKVFEKTIYSVVNKELIEYIKENNIEQIYLCGFDTDACVLKTALDLFENNYEVYVLKDYCMCSAGQKIHNETIENLKRLIGREYVI